MRRGSFDLEDLFHAHIGGMDTFARGLEIAQRIIDDGVLGRFVAERYSSFGCGIGKQIMAGKGSFQDMEEYVLEHGEPEKRSGREEMLENIVNGYIR